MPSRLDGAVLCRRRDRQGSYPPCPRTDSGVQNWRGDTAYRTHWALQRYSLSHYVLCQKNTSKFATRMATTATTPLPICHFSTTTAMMSSIEPSSWQEPVF